MRIQWERSYLQTRMRALTKTWSHWQPGLCLPASCWLGHSVYDILVWQLELTNVHILLVLFLWIQMPSFFSVPETIYITLTFSVLEKFEKSHPQNNFLFEVSLIASCVSYEAAHLFRFYISSWKFLKFLNLKIPSRVCGYTSVDISNIICVSLAF